MLSSFDMSYYHKLRTKRDEGISHGGGHDTAAPGQLLSAGLYL